MATRKWPDEVGMLGGCKRSFYVRWQGEGSRSTRCTLEIGKHPRKSQYRMSAGQHGAAQTDYVVIILGP